MKAKTEELLYLLLWSVDRLTRPTFRNLDDSFESWAYRNGFLRRLHELERQQYIERNRSRATHRIYRLTERGRLHVLGGRDPEQRWSRPWDGRWRVVLFDLPRVESAARKRLHQRLKAEGFGCLQNSVWISPDPVSRDIRSLCGRGDDVETLITLEGTPCAGERNRNIVNQAWDFEKIEERYRAHRAILRQLPAKPVSTEVEAGALRRWSERERRSWQAAMMCDPLLPAVLLPAGYLGREVWKERQNTLGNAASLIRQISL